MTVFKKETLQHIILSRCRVMVLLNQYIQQLRTCGGAIPIQCAEDTEVAPCIKVIEPSASIKVNLCFWNRTSSPVQAVLKVFYLVSTHSSTDLPLFVLSPFSSIPRELMGSTSLQARHGFSWGAGEVRTKEKKRKGMKGSGFCLLRSSQEERKITA